MKKSVKKGIVLLIGVIFIITAIYVIWYVNSVPNYYQYPINDSMDARTLLIKCRIPKETLKDMTDEQLAQAVADFPLLIDVLTVDSMEEGVECLADESDAYKELLSRENGRQALIDKVKELEACENPEIIKTEILKEVIRNEPLFKTDLTEEEN